MKKINLIFILFVSAFTSNAQTIQRSVIGSAGGTTTAGSITLSSTVGETFTNKLTTANGSIKQGFQQGNILIARIANTELPATISEAKTIAPEKVETELMLNIFPNPTTDFVNIATETDEQINLTVIDAQGKIIKQLQHSSTQTQIDFTQLTAGTYFIVAQSANSRNTYKVIKQQ
ncbi:MAG TPA: T9SS type A sorting domain-containing protein [Bacteroidia bacterium]|nr:T9SS type A sorting domain-containing protein [Bacteroidia bacterium]